MRILVVGAGAIGGYFGGRLAQGGGDVTFLVRPARAATLAREGLRVRSPLGDISMPVAAATAELLRGPFDLVLLACKAYDLANALAAVGPVLGSETAVLPLLNGVSHLGLLEERLGTSRALGGVAHLAATLQPDGVVRHLSPRAAIRFGPIVDVRDRWSQLLLEAFTRAGVDAVLSRGIVQDLWDKLVFLATLAGMTCLMRASVGTILATHEGAKLMQQLLVEGGAGAAAEGHAPDGAALAHYRATLMERDSPLTASMLRDLERGGPTEAEHVLGDLVRRGSARSVDAPLLRIAYTHLQAYETNRGAASARRREDA